jgi:hypothetical protein
MQPERPTGCGLPLWGLNRSILKAMSVTETGPIPEVLGLSMIARRQTSADGPPIQSLVKPSNHGSPARNPVN